MPRRVWLSLVMLATGAALMVAAQLAGAGRERKGGIFEVGTTGASVQIDPQLSYITTGWWLEYATAAKLYNYRPGGKLVPEVASRFTVSNRGKRYTFFLRKGFRFSDGTPVTARNFEYAFDRATSPKLQSPAAQFVTNVKSVSARRMKLVIDLGSNKGELISILAMPLFQATSTKLPLDREVVDVRSIADLPSAGPYAFTLNDVNRLTELRRNPYWKRGPGRVAPRNLDGLDLQWNLDEQAAFHMVEANRLDEGPLPDAEVEGVANRYGVNKTRFWVKPLGCISWVPLNNRKGLFAHNAPMRRAVNWAIDRTDYLRGTAPYSQTPWTHLIPPGYPGSITKPALQPYGIRANIATAKRIAAGHYKDGHVVLAYRSRGSGNSRAESVRDDLTRLGLNVTVRPVDEPYPPRWDLFVGYGWCVDHADPADFLLMLWRSQEPWWPSSTKYDPKIQNANSLSGQARVRAFGKLDVEIMKDLAPTVVTSSYNNRFFFSNRVDPRSLKYHGVYSDWSIPALALK